MVILLAFTSSCMIEEEIGNFCPPYRETRAQPVINEIKLGWVEVYNPGPDRINLCHYRLRAPSNINYRVGSTDFKPLELSVEPGSYALLKFETPKDRPPYRSLQIVGIENNPNRPSLDRGGEISFRLNNRSITSASIASTNADTLRSSENSYSKINNRWQMSFATPGGSNDVNLPFIDEDDDGIPDANERDGTTFLGMPLHQWGARPDQKDIFVHLNYMDPDYYTGVRGGDDPGLIPSLEVLEKIKVVFQEKDFFVHFDVGNLHGTSDFNLSGKSHEVPAEWTTSLNPYSSVDPNSIYAYKNQHLPLSRFQIFHYGLMANKHLTERNTVGKGEVLGNDFIVFWGGGTLVTNSPNYIRNRLSSTIMHELGHNLGLKHGGRNDINNKPNYPSTMNYLYTQMGLPKNSQGYSDRYQISQKCFQGNGGCTQTEIDLLSIYKEDENFKIDFSDGNLSLLNEASLDERAGVDSSGAIDWNLDGGRNYYYWGLDGGRKYYYVSYDINFDGKINTLHDYNDWDNIKLPFRNIPGYYDNYRSRAPGLRSRRSATTSTRFNPLEDDVGNWQE